MRWDKPTSGRRAPVPFRQLAARGRAPWAGLRHHDNNHHHQHNHLTGDLELATTAAAAAAARPPIMSSHNALSSGRRRDEIAKGDAPTGSQPIGGWTTLVPENPKLAERSPKQGGTKCISPLEYCSAGGDKCGAVTITGPGSDLRAGGDWEVC